MGKIVAGRKPCRVGGEGVGKENILLVGKCRQDSPGKVIKLRNVKPGVRGMVEGIVTGNPRGLEAHAKGKVHVHGEEEGKSPSSLDCLRQMWEGYEFLGKSKDYATSRNSDKSEILLEFNELNAGVTEHSQSELWEDRQWSRGPMGGKEQGEME